MMGETGIKQINKKKEYWSLFCDKIPWRKKKITDTRREVNRHIQLSAEGLPGGKFLDLKDEEPVVWKPRRMF